MPPLRVFLLIHLCLRVCGAYRFGSEINVAFDALLSPAASSNHTDAANSDHHTPEAKPKIQKYSGYVGHIRRLLYPYEDRLPEDRFSEDSPHLLTIVHGGIVENDKVLPAGKARALLAYPFAQSLPEESATKVLETPFVWKRTDGSYAHVQTWTTKYNDAFKLAYEVSESNPDESKFEPQAVAEFKSAMTGLFGEDAGKIDVLYCSKDTQNNKSVYVGKSEDLLDFLSQHPDVVEELKISLLDDGFVAHGVDGNQRKFDKEFHFSPGIEYALYTKGGWETMACITLLEQFVTDRDVYGPISLQKAEVVSTSDVEQDTLDALGPAGSETEHAAANSEGVKQEDDNSKGKTLNPLQA